MHGSQPRKAHKELWQEPAAPPVMVKPGSGIAGCGTPCLVPRAAGQSSRQFAAKLRAPHAWSLRGAGENNKRALMLSLPSILVFNADFFFLSLLLKCPWTMRLLSTYSSMRLVWVLVSAEPAHLLPHSYRNRC